MLPSSPTLLYISTLAFPLTAHNCLQDTTDVHKRHVNGDFMYDSKQVMCGNNYNCTHTCG